MSEPVKIERKKESPETVLLGTQDIVKMDGFEDFSNIIHIALFDHCDIQNLSDCTEMFCPVCQIEGVFFIYEWKNVIDAHNYTQWP